MRVFVSIIWIFAAATGVGDAVLYAMTGPAWAAAFSAGWATFLVGIALRFIIREARS